jgi:hypothetical protein
LGDQWHSHVERGTTMKLKSRWTTKSVLVPAAVAAVTAAVMAAAPALAQSPAHRPAQAAAAVPVIKTGWKNGPVAVGTSATTVASMPLAQGSWAIFAKAWLHGGSNPSLVTCNLTAGADYDNATTALETGASSAYAEPIALNVGHKFASAGSVTLACTNSSGTVSANYIKITAVKAGTLTIVKLP